MQLQTTPQRNFSQNKNLGIKGCTVGKRKSIQISASSKNVDILLFVEMFKKANIVAI